jgi:hypothetical protein
MWVPGFFCGMAIALDCNGALNIMLVKRTNYLLAGIFALFACSGAFAQAHPGEPGHTHFPNEVDEFDQKVAVSPAAVENRNFNLGGILVLTSIAGCIGLAIFKKRAESKLMSLSNSDKLTCT